MQHLSRVAVGLFLAWAVVACTPIIVDQNSGGLSPIKFRVDNTAYWLEEWHRALKMPDAQFQNLIKLRRNVYEKKPTARNRLRLALLLAVSNKPNENQDEVLRLAREVQIQEVDASVIALAALLEKISEQQSNSDIQGTLNSKSLDLQAVRELKAAEARKEELEEHIEQKQKTEAMAEALEKAEARIEELEQQVQDLTSIEQHIQDRSEELPKQDN